MPATADDRFRKLRSLGYTGTVNDMMFAWLKDNGYGTAKTLNDAWSDMLELKGFFDVSVSDAWFKYLGNLGYAGSLMDREAKFWAGGNITGRNLIPNFNFAQGGTGWLPGTGWVIQPGNAAVATDATGTLRSTVPGTTFQVGKTYRCTYQLVFVTSGACRFEFVGSGVSLPYDALDGIYQNDVTILSPVTSFQIGVPAGNPFYGAIIGATFPGAGIKVQELV